MCQVDARILLPFLASLVFSGCASIFHQTESPEVLVTDIKPLDSTIFEQHLQVDLRLRNPNDFDLHVTGLDFTLDLNGQRLARGLTNQTLTIPRLGDAVLAVKTSTSTLDVVRQLFNLSQDQDVSYHLKGILHLKGSRLPFEQEGVLIDIGGMLKKSASRVLAIFQCSRTACTLRA